ncbi:MAG: hypothetical protein HYZ34_00125, partial [Ignavibacteriae bacterium]|nr:hypothetical protein [Ignavibacteriota bacterium]
MKILLVSPMLYHSQSGHGTGSFMAGLLHRLGKRHDVTLVAFCNKEELALASTMNDAPFRLITVPRGKGAQKNLFWRLYLVLIRLYAMLRSLLFWQPYYVSKYRHPRMARLITTLTTEERFDIVQIELAQMAQYRKFIVNGKTVLHEHDVAFRPAYRGYKNSHS